MDFTKILLRGCAIFAVTVVQNAMVHQIISVINAQKGGFYIKLLVEHFVLKDFTMIRNKKRAYNVIPDAQAAMVLLLTNVIHVSQDFISISQLLNAHLIAQQAIIKM